MGRERGSPGAARSAPRGASNVTTDQIRIRLSLDLSPELNARIEQIVRSTHASNKSEVLRKAIALMDVAVQAQEQGRKLYVGDNPPAGTSREIVGL